LKSSLNILIISFLFLSFQPQYLKAEDGFIEFLESLYSNSKDYPKNQTYLEFSYGLSAPDIKTPGFVANIPDVAPADLYYGFFRKHKVNDYPKMFSFNNEAVFLGNMSYYFQFPKFKREFPKPAMTIDAWRFGGSLSNGYGYKINGEERIMLAHRSEWTWSRTDFQTLSLDSATNVSLLLFDEKIKFGTKFASFTTIKLWSSVHLNAGYESMMIYQDFHLGQWLGAWVVDNIAQRSIDYFEDELIEIYGYHFPVFYFLYKSGVSYVLYEFRKNSSFFPFGGDPVMRFDGFKLSISLII